VLLGVGHDDSEKELGWLAEKTVGLRIFEDDDGKMNRSLADVGGAMLVVNRGVPFALAAMAPVNINGTFIALFVEGDPAISLVAVVTMAVNALLMFAYLPWYRNVLSPGQLADGEAADDGHNYVSLYANPLGNAPASACPGAAAVLAAAAAFYWFVVPGLNSMTGLVVLAIPAVILATGWARALTRKKA